MKKNKILKTLVAIILLISIETLSIAVTGTVNSETVRVREKATTDSEIVEVVNIGDKINIIGEEGNWYKVKVGNVEGYIRKDLLTVNGEVNVPSTPETPSEEPDNPVENPSENPTENPSDNPAENPSDNPTENPSENPNENPTDNPTETVNTDIIKNDKSISVISNVSTVGQTIQLQQNTKVKALPLVYSSNIAEFQANTEVTVLEVINKWCRIEQGNYAGWVRIS